MAGSAGPGDAGEGLGWGRHQASNNMKAMEIGDLAFFYHSANEKQIVGIVEIIELYHPDNRQERTFRHGNGKGGQKHGTACDPGRYQGR